MKAERGWRMVGFIGACHVPSMQKGGGESMKEKSRRAVNFATSRVEKLMGVA